MAVVPLLDSALPGEHLRRAGGIERRLASHGVRCAFQVSDQAVWRTIAPFLPPCWQPSIGPDVDAHLALLGPPHGGAYRLYADGAFLGQIVDRQEAALRLASEAHFAVAVHAPRDLFVHAGVVSWRGRALLLPGRSFAGKTSLVAALLRAGAGYFSDEYAVLGDDGRVQPYPKPLSQRDPLSGRARPVPADRLTVQVGGAPLPLGGIVVTAYQPGATWRPRRLTPGQALLALLEHTPVARARPRFAMSRLAQAIPGAIALASPRGDADELAARLLTYLAQEWSAQ